MNASESYKYQASYACGGLENPPYKKLHSFLNLMALMGTYNKTLAYYYQDLDRICQIKHTKG